MKPTLLFKKIILGTFSLLLISSVFLSLPARAQDTTLYPQPVETTTSPAPTPSTIKDCPDDAIKLSTYIPGLPQCKSSGGETNYYIQNLAEYIILIYDFALAVAGILAVTMITFGGYLWLTAGGNPGRVGKAKEYIVSAITGLILALGAFTILYFVNPKILSPSLSVSSIEPVISVDKFCENIKDPKLKITPTSGDCGKEGQISLASAPKEGEPTFKLDKTTCIFNTCSNGGFCVEKSALNQTYLDAHSDIKAMVATYVCAQ